jgi:hypothetical protein
MWSMCIRYLHEWSWCEWETCVMIMNCLNNYHLHWLSSMWLIRETLCYLWGYSVWSLVYIIVWDTKTSTCINWWSHFMEHRYGDIKLIIWTHVRNMVLDRPTPRHCWDCYFCMCHELVSSGTTTRSLYLRSPLFLTMCSCALWDCQTLLCNWVVIKVIFGCITKYEMGCERIKMEFVPPK